MLFILQCWTLILLNKICMKRLLIVVEKSQNARKKKWHKVWKSAWWDKNMKLTVIWSLWLTKRLRTHKHTCRCSCTSALLCGLITVKGAYLVPFARFYRCEKWQLPQLTLLSTKVSKEHLFNRITVCEKCECMHLSESKKNIYIEINEILSKRI